MCKSIVAPYKPSWGDAFCLNTCWHTLFKVTSVVTGQKILAKVCRPSYLLIAGHQGAQQAEAFDAQRQRQGVHLRPPMPPPLAVPTLFPTANSSQSGSVYDSDYGSVDRNSVSGSEVASPVKSMQVMPASPRSQVTGFLDCVQYFMHASNTHFCRTDTMSRCYVTIC